MLFAGAQSLPHKSLHTLSPAFPYAAVPQVTAEALQDEAMRVKLLQLWGKVPFVSRYYIVKRKEVLVKIEHVTFDEAKSDDVLGREHDEERRRCFEIEDHYDSQTLAGC